MRDSVRLHAFLIILSTVVAGIVVLGCKGGDDSLNGEPVGESVGESVTSEPGVNLIAYVDPNGQIKTVDPDGSSTTRISPAEGVFTWPIWSPDGSQIVFSGAPPASDGRALLTLYAYQLEDEQTRIIFTNEPGIGPIFQGVPHYPLWAPDSGRLAFMASSPEGLTLFVTDPRAEVGAGVVLRNAPLYASWSSNSLNMVVHGDLDHFLVDVEGEVTVRDLGIRSPSHRVPAWWPSGNRIVFVSEDDPGMRRMYIADLVTGERILLENVQGGAAFLWSPNGESLAVASTAWPGAVIHRGVRLYSPDGTRRPVEIRENIIAFFWSPDSTKLAYVTLSSKGGYFSWKVLNVADGSQWPLVDFIPSVAQATLLRFFDQFAYSHSPWSPQSDSLVFAGVLFEEAVLASLNRQPVFQIFVMDASGDSSAQSIAEGGLAVWSPR